MRVYPNIKDAPIYKDTCVFMYSNTIFTDFLRLAVKTSQPM